MAENTKLGFVHLSGALSTVTPVVGEIYFSDADHTIGVYDGSVMQKYYGGNVKNAVYADKKLTITYMDGTTQAVLDFSDVASAEGVSSILSDLRKDVNTLKDDYASHIADVVVHVTADDKATWSGKQDALSTEDLARIAAVDGKANAADLGSAAAKNVLAGSIADSTSDDLVTAAQVKTYAAGVVGAMHFRGTVASTDAITEPASGDICLVGTKEYVYDGSNWALFGDEGAYEAAGTAQDLIDALDGEASSVPGADVVITVKSSKGVVSEVSVDSSVLAGRVKALEDADSKDVTAAKIVVWDAVAAKKDDYDSHIADVVVHVTADDRAEWNSKAAGNHNHDNAYSQLGHTHIIADVTGLQAALDGKATSDHKHDGVYDEAGAAATAKSDVIGKSGDASSANTIYGAKAYADEVAAEAMTWAVF